MVFRRGMEMKLFNVEFLRVALDGEGAVQNDFDGMTEPFEGDLGLDGNIEDDGTLGTFLHDGPIVVDGIDGLGGLGGGDGAVHPVLAQGMPHHGTCKRHHG